MYEQELPPKPYVAQNHSEYSENLSPRQSAEELEEDEEVELMESCPYLISFLTEFLAMAIQMFVGCTGSINKFGIGPVIESFSFGMGRLACYEIFNHISPLHINPAKSLGFVVLGRMSLIRFVIYVTAQYCGAAAGMCYVWLIKPKNVYSVCVPHAGQNSTTVTSFWFEFMTTFFLMLVVSGATDPMNQTLKDSFNLRIGMVVTVLIMSIEPFTAAGKNPSRSFGPVLLANRWDDCWLYQVAPFLGAVLGAFIYRFLFNVRQKYSVHYMCSRMTFAW